LSKNYQEKVEISVLVVTQY